MDVMNDLQFKCTKLSVVQGLKNGILAGPFQTKFEVDNCVVSITQRYKREIELTSNVPVISKELIFIFQDIEKLLMLFDGRFYTIEKITVSRENSEPMDILADYIKMRLNYFSSKDFCQYSWLKLISFQDVLTSNLYKNWKALIDDLDIAFQVFLYALSDNKMTVDLNFAFLVELAEPFVELLKERTYYCQSLNPGERGTTLKMCVDNLIVLYGTDIFAKEIEENENYKLFLNRVVNSRVRIMHIKKNQKAYFDGRECLKYSLKFSLLYRKFLLSLLDISCQEYNEKIQIATKNIDDWRMGEVN